MNGATDCVFCRLLAGEIPSTRVCEDEHAVAVMDINPAAEGHVLVIAREHAPDLMTASPESVQATVLLAQRVARAMQAALAPEGLNLLQANGPGAAQSVPHLHLHLIPRRVDDGLTMSWLLNPGDRVAIQRIAERIRAEMNPV